MSEQDRMDRARRIKQLREGRRRDEQDTDQTPDEEDDLESEATESDAGGDSAASEADEAEEAALDDAVVEAVERVSGTSASVPNPDEMTDVEDAHSAERAANPANVSPEANARAEPDAPHPPDHTGESESADGAEESSSGDTQSDTADDEHAGFADSDNAVAVGHRAVADTRVLEFTLGDEHYCIDIEYVEEIVKDETITRVPNTPEFVDGVVDLRGQITTILNPKLLIGTEETEPGELLIVFDSEAFDDQGHLGWIVDDVRQVAPVTDEQVDDPPEADEAINGVIDRGDDEPFVVWTSPVVAIEEAT